MADEPVSLPSERSARKQLPEEVAAYVRELIISGAVRPGDFLRMEPIAEAVGVSNTPVREGLLALRSEGFVRLEPRRGFVVEPFTRQDVHDLFWAQSQFGGELAARAARNITPEEVGRLEILLEKHRKAVQDGDDAMADLGHAFHREINKAARSQRLALLLGSVVRHLPNRFYAAIEGHIEATLDKHALLLTVLREGDAETSRSLMQRHILEGGERLLESLEKRGLWDDDSEASAS